jgi:hypothetical protein
MPPLRFAIAWKARWCLRIPSTVSAARSRASSPRAAAAGVTSAARAEAAMASDDTAASRLTGVRSMIVPPSSLGTSAFLPDARWLGAIMIRPQLTIRWLED